MCKYDRYRIEVSPPRQKADSLIKRLDSFAEKYMRVMESGATVCITDNAMGNLCFQGYELVKELRLPVPERRLMPHLNTFHSLAELHKILDAGLELGIKDFLVISGDGSSRLPKLLPQEIGSKALSVTSVELIAYIKARYPGAFRLGAAFNQYEPEDHEHAKFLRKIEAGADFFITQPLLKKTETVDRAISESRLPFVIEAWMSPNVKLLADCIGYPLDTDSVFNPMDCLKSLEANYADSSVYLALLDMKTQFYELGKR